METPSNILILEDLAPYQKSLKKALEELFPQASLRIIDNLSEALESAKKEKFDLALVDLNLKGEKGAVFIRETSNADNGPFCVVYTVYDDDVNLFECLKAGAKGYLLKELKRRELKSELSKILKGQPPLSPFMAKKIFDFFNSEKNVESLSNPPNNAPDSKPILQEDSKEKSKPDQDSTKLTKREEQVLTLLSLGDSVKIIADKLEVSRYTASAHVRNIYQKLQVHTRVEVLSKAVKMGYVDLDELD